MGAVYRVLDLRTGTRLALKRLHVKSRKDEALAHFEREFYTLAQLRHPRIIAVHDYGVDAFSAYYTMELLAGADMRSLAPLPWTLACRYLREVATSLALLHARRLVHRDVTPQNVRVGQDGHCKLIDFGALADFGEGHAVVGTPPCVPPEAIDGKPIDQRLDLYALGCLGYWMLTGRHAYPATDPRQLRAFWARTLSPPSVGRPTQGEGGVPLPEIPAALDALVMKLLALDPMARPSSAGAVIDQLDVIMRGHHTPSTRPPRTNSIAPEDTSLAESYLVSAPLCGRNAELEPVRPTLERTRRGRGASLILEGPAGVGRTRLLADVALRTRLLGFTTLHVDAAEHTQPLSAMRALAAQLSGGEPEPDYGHAQLHGMFVEASRKRPIALIVDDVHRLDEASLRVLGTLAHDARRLQLAIISAIREGDEALSESSLLALRNCSLARPVRDLTEPAVREWLSSVLGEAPSLARLASNLFTRSGGRAATIAAMMRALIDRGELRYREGVWVLPNQPAQIVLPEREDEVALERLQALPAAARELAEALCMYRASISEALCALIAGECGDAIVELLDSGLWLRGAEGFRFASDALRERISSTIDQARAAQLHRGLAHAILELPARQGRERTPDEQLTAAVHMLEARDVRGVSLAVEAAHVIFDRATGLAGVVRLLERALELSRPLGISPVGRLALLSPLGLAAYLVDHRLARHEAEIREALDQVCGLDVARRLAHAFSRAGKWAWAVGAWLGLAYGIARYYVRPRGDSPDNPRPGRFRAVTRLGVASLVSLAGRAAISLDRAAALRAYEHIKPLSVLGRDDSGGFAVAYCKGLALATEDRYERTYQHWLDLERRISTPGSLADVQGEQRALWEAGAGYVLGLFEGFRGDARALTRAERLERSSNGLHRMIATQIRLQYHGFRGEAELVRKAHERMEACAIEVGSSWQVETWSAIAINLFGSFWHDIIITKRALRETQRMAHELPSLKRYAITSEAVYLMRRGQPRDCADLYEPLLAQEPPLSRIGWSVSSGLLAEAYNQLGMHREAKELCERVLATVSVEDKPYYAMRIAVEVPYGVALAALGEYERGRAHLLELLELYAPAASPAALGTVHEALARIELGLLDRGLGDRRRFTDHLKQVERYFTTLGNPALIARFQALSDAAGQGGGILTKVALHRELHAFEAALEPITNREKGAREILAWLMRSCEGYDGYLFARRDELAAQPSSAPASDDPIELLAATGEREPGEEVFRTVAEALDALGGSGDTTNFGTSAASKTRRDGSSTHLFLLSYLDADEFNAEGALVLLGRAPAAPPVRYELLQAAALQLRRLTRPDVA